MTEPDRTEWDARLDFDRLRAEVEATTILPEFREVARRARRRRKRSRMGTIGLVLVLLAILVPAGTLADWQRGRPGVISGPDGSTLTTPSPEPTPAPASPAGPPPSPTTQVNLVAVAGVDLDHVYTLIDVCLSDSCSLQLSRIMPEGPGVQVHPLRTNLLRRNAISFLSGVRLTALTATSVQVSGQLSTGWHYQRVDLVGVDGAGAATEAQPAQLEAGGKVDAVSQASGIPTELPSQPSLAQPSVVPGIPVNRGVWVTGVATSGKAGVAVSQDGGTSWVVRDLGVPAGGQSVLATLNGSTAYLLVRLPDWTFALFRTGDGGRSWHKAAGQPWSGLVPAPVGATYGLAVRPDGSLLAWLSGANLTYAESRDGGQSFHAFVGPRGQVFQVSDGYVLLGATPMLSHDAVNWSPAELGYEPPGG
jgi:hypothetical protein